MQGKNSFQTMSLFKEIWKSLFTTHIHLDSALSKLPRSAKSILAQILPIVLRQPASQSEKMGVGISIGEPWSLDQKDLSEWRPAFLLASRIYEGMTQGLPEARPIRGDFPESMILEWERDWGDKTAQQLLSILASQPPLSLRSNRLFSAQALLDQLRSERILPVKITLSDLSPVGVRLSGYAPILGSELYKKGAFEIQDEGSQVMALFALWPERYSFLLKKNPGEIQNKQGVPALPSEVKPIIVVDACAGAGGKSLAMADALQGKGRVFAYDTSRPKLLALKRRATRAGLNNIQTVLLVEGKELEAISKFQGSAQVVLVDAPCSGWGVLRRNPDLKWRQDLEMLLRMPKIQSRLLEQYATLVAPGGRLVYGVCTFRKEETLYPIQEFLKAHPDFSLSEGGYLGPEPCDGFFMQALIRKPSRRVAESPEY